MTRRGIKIWSFVHTWTSLISTGFLLMLCITGLPLIFQEEIGHWLEPEAPFAVVPGDARPANMDRLVERARAEWPGYLVTSISVNPDEPETFVSLAPSWEAYVDDPANQPFIGFDTRTGDERERFQPAAARPLTFVEWMYRLHIDMFLGLPGQLFLLTIGLLFVAAIVSGAVLYGPFTKRLDFGTIRLERPRRVRWLDIHNLLGITTLAWAGVVGFTGSLNNLESPFFMRFLEVDVANVVAAWENGPAPAQERLASVSDAVTRVRSKLPDKDVIEIVYPRNPYGTTHHYMVWLVGKTPLTRHMETTALVDAVTGNVSEVVDMPWYLRAIEVARPLHFGNYGGLPLKIIWAVFDLATILLLSSGLYLWFSKRRSSSLGPHVAGGEVRTSPALEAAK